MTLPQNKTLRVHSIETYYLLGGPKFRDVRILKLESADYPFPRGLHPRIIHNYKWYCFSRPRIIRNRSQGMPMF